MIEYSQTNVIGTPTINATLIATLSGEMLHEGLVLDKLEPIEEVVVPLGEYLFSN